MPPKHQKRSSTQRTTQTKRSRFISNHQVAQLLLQQQQQAQQQQSSSITTPPPRRPTHATWIRERVLWYLQTGAPRSSLLESFSDARLSRDECWQMTNTAPTELVELDLIVANINERFTETEQTAVLETIAQAVAAQQQKTKETTSDSTQATSTTNGTAYRTIAAVTPPDGSAANQINMEED